MKNYSYFKLFKDKLNICCWTRFFYRNSRNVWYFLIVEGGRLQKELSYASEALGEAAASTHQLVIQTPKDPGANILHPAALKEHLAILKAATQVTVRLFDT